MPRGTGSPHASRTRATYCPADGRRFALSVLHDQRGAPYRPVGQRFRPAAIAIAVYQSITTPCEAARIAPDGMPCPSTSRPGSTLRIKRCLSVVVMVVRTARAVHVGRQRLELPPEHHRVDALYPLVVILDDLARREAPLAVPVDRLLVAGLQAARSWIMPDIC